MINIFADLVYFILKANRIKKHFTYYLGVGKLLNLSLLLLFCSIVSMERGVSGRILSTYFKIFLRSVCYSRNLLL